VNFSGATLKILASIAHKRRKMLPILHFPQAALYRAARSPGIFHSAA